MKKRLFLGLIIFTALGLGLLARPKPAAQATDTRVVTVHTDGVTKTIATNAPTVKSALERLGTSLGKNDKTEPAADQQIEGTEYTINVYRARPISVVDGANTYTVTTAQRSPREIAKEAGFNVGQEDQFAFERSDDPTLTTPGTQMVIKRAKNITFSLYGTSSPLETHENTVAELLSERDVNLDPTDEVNVPLAARITEGMTVSIDRVDKNVQTVEEVAPFPTQQIQDVNQPTTYKKVKTPGVNGKKLVTYKIISRNGQEAEKQPIKEVITVQPITEVLIVGARQAVNLPGDCGKWLAEAGITDPNAMWLIGKESGCNPGSVNRRSGACGIPQALPCSKLPCSLDATGAVCQLRWMDKYVRDRYGSWAGARAHHTQTGWY